jgi:hypothetical protein
MYITIVAINCHSLFCLWVISPLQCRSSILVFILFYICHICYPTKMSVYLRKSFDQWKLTLIFSRYKPELSMMRSCPDRLEFKNECYSTVNQSISKKQWYLHWEIIYSILSKDNLKMLSSYISRLIETRTKYITIQEI